MSDKTVNQEIQEYLNEKQLDLENHFKKSVADLVEEYSDKYSAEINKLRKGAKFAEDYGGLQLMKIIQGGGQIVSVDEFKVNYPEHPLKLEIEGQSLLGFDGRMLKRGRYKLTIIIEKLGELKEG